MHISRLLEAIHMSERIGASKQRSYRLAKGKAKDRSKEMKENRNEGQVLIEAANHCNFKTFCFYMKRVFGLNFLGHF